ncbi:MAG TPA: AMP-binding protein [Candidatus Limnocylindria bacterium]|nr:AMP-binding protein [Candidatus Limnocylindria bacterium]
MTPLPPEGPADAVALSAPSETLAGLRELLDLVARQNPFYRQKWAGLALPESLAAFVRDYPFTHKPELVADQNASPPYGTNQTYPVTDFVRLHQTSGTSGKPLRWLDTPESWANLREDWAEVFLQAGLTTGDRVLFAFSFGPFLGFWLAFEAAQGLGALCIAGGGMSSALRLRVLLENQCTVLCCTPTYALHLAEEARKEGVDLKASKVRLLVVAGEPGGSIPSVRERLSEAWNNARIFDHHGMTEVGPVTFEHPQLPGNLVVVERSFLAEVVDTATGRQLGPGERGELVLTTLRRAGMPLVRYRTGDIVCARREESSGWLLLEGGILGRVDDMVVVRGVNVYPAAIDEIVRALCGTAEYRVNLDTRTPLTELSIEVEAEAGVAAALESQLRQVLSLRIPVSSVEVGVLPRYEMKARRWRRL